MQTIFPRNALCVSPYVTLLTWFTYSLFIVCVKKICLVYAVVCHVAEIIGYVKNGPQGSKPAFRPTVDDDLGDDGVVQMMKRCWVEDPNERPDFPVLKATIRRLNK